MNITPVIEAAVALMAAILTYVLIPWVKSKETAQQTAELLKWVDIAVMAAQQVYHQQNGEVRKGYVLAFLREKGYDVDSEDVDNAIEAAVLRLHKELGDGNNG